MRPTPRPNDNDFPRPRPNDDNYPRPRPEDKPLFPKVTDKQKLEQFKKQVQNYRRWDANSYQRAIGGSFDRIVSNNDDYMQAVNDAASQNKPIVMMIGSSNDAASRHVIENSLRQARNSNGKDAVYVFVDTDRVDRNSAIGRYAFENMPRAGQEPPFTMVFSMSRSSDPASPVRADAPTYYKMGEIDSAPINEAVSRLKLEMSGRFSNINLPRPTDTSKTRPSDNPGPEYQNQNQNQTMDKRIQEAIALALVQAQRQENPENSYQYYKQAIDLADKSGNHLLEAASRIELGIACIKWGFADTGYKWIMDGAAKNPELYNQQRNQPFTDRLKQAGIPDATISLLMENGSKDPLWYQKDSNAGKKLEASASKPQFPNYLPQTLPLNPVNPGAHLRPSPFR